MSYPNHFFITSGCGESRFKLVAFDEALRNAQIADYNLIKISSILPKKCQMATSKEFPVKGSGLLTAFGSISSNENGKQIASAVAVAIPEDIDEVGVIMEYSGYCSAKYAEGQVRLMATEAMKNRNRKIKEIRSTSTEGVSDGENFVAVISAICIW